MMWKLYTHIYIVPLLLVVGAGGACSWVSLDAEID